MPVRPPLAWPLAAALVCAQSPVRAQHAAPPLEAASFEIPAAPDGRAEADRQIRRARLPQGWTASVWAAEPEVIHPVGFDITDDGRVFVAESLRAWRGVPDIRNLMQWLDEDIASRSVDDRLAFMRRLWGDEGLRLYSKQSERVRRLIDLDGDGRADRSTVFAEGFNTPLDGVGSSVLARGNDVWFANIPDIWHLRDADGDGVAEERRSLSHGHGVRISMLGHDLHGLVWGPDGRIYVSVGDRGSMVLHNGQWIGHPECGAVFRFEPDGSGFEMFAQGLRNPQELVFDDWGNLFSGDNSANSGDEARWVCIQRGGDSGWRIGWQWAENRTGINDGNWRGGAEGPGANAPWVTEGFWKPAHAGQPAYIVPPIANFSAGPCGNAFYPGTGLDPSWDGNFLLTDFRGSSNDSLVWRFRVQPEGAGFKVVDRTQWLGGINATDIAFGPDGAVWVLDWTDGWEPAARGRIHRLLPPASEVRPNSPAPTALLKAGFRNRTLDELVTLLAHADRRVRQGAQFELADRGSASFAVLSSAVSSTNPVSTRRHAAWALGQIARHAQRQGGIDPARAIAPVIPLLGDVHPGIRATAATVLGELRPMAAVQPLITATADPDAGVRREAAQALGQIGNAAAVPALVTVLRSNADQDPFLRHAAVMGLLGSADAITLARLGSDPSPAVRLAVVVALRRLERTEVSRFLTDPEPRVRAEAARAIHDVPIASALPDLAQVPMERLTENAFARRVVNACLRVGSAGSAQRLVAIATAPQLAEAIRVDALAALAAWPGNAGRDRITGLWRPLPLPRDREIPATALEPSLGKLLNDGPESILAEAAVTAGVLQIRNADTALAALAGGTQFSARSRIAALESLAQLGAPTLGALLDRLPDDADPAVRAVALRLASRASGPDALPRLRRVLEKGTISDQQAALAALARLEVPDSIALRGEWMDRLLAGAVPLPLHLDVLEAAATQPSAALAQKTAAYRAAVGTNDLAPYRVALEGGSAAAGRAVFNRPEVECIRCHKLYGRGGEVGPELSTVATRLDRMALLASIVTPDLQLAPGYETVLVTLDDAETVAGIAIGETAQQLSLRLPDGTRQDLDKARIRSRERGRSAMPTGLAEILGPRSLRDLLEFLSTLK